MKFIIDSSLFAKQIEVTLTKIAFEFREETRQLERMEQNSMKSVVSILGRCSSTSECGGQDSIKPMESTSNKKEDSHLFRGSYIEPSSDFDITKRSPLEIGIKMEEYGEDITTCIKYYPFGKRSNAYRNIRKDALDKYGLPQNCSLMMYESDYKIHQTRMYLDDWYNRYFVGKDNINWTEIITTPHWEATLAECAYADFHIAINNEIGRLERLIGYDVPFVEEDGDAYPANLSFRKYYDREKLKILYEELIAHSFLLDNPSLDDFVYAITGMGNQPIKRLKWKQKNVCRYFVQRFLNSNWEVAERCFTCQRGSIESLDSATNIAKGNKETIDNLLLQIWIPSPAKESR